MRLISLLKLMQHQFLFMKNEEREPWNAYNNHIFQQQFILWWLLALCRVFWVWLGRADSKVSDMHKMNSSFVQDERRFSFFLRLALE